MLNSAENLCFDTNLFIWDALEKIQFGVPSPISAQPKPFPASSLDGWGMVFVQPSFACGILWGGGEGGTLAHGLEMFGICILAVTLARRPKSQFRRDLSRVQPPTWYGFHTLERTK